MLVVCLHGSSGLEERERTMYTVTVKLMSALLTPNSVAMVGKEGK